MPLLLEQTILLRIEQMLSLQQKNYVGLLHDRLLLMCWRCDTLSGIRSTLLAWCTDMISVLHHLKFGSAWIRILRDAFAPADPRQEA